MIRREHQSCLWSLAVLIFNAAIFVLVVERLQSRATIIKDSNLSDSTENGKKLVNELLDEVSEYIDVLPSASDFALKIKILRDRVQSGMKPVELGVRLEALHQDICADLLKPAFLLIPEDKADLFEQKQPPLTDDVIAAFPAIRDDICAAARCLAFDEWTASVFHAMRVLEHVLRRLAAEFSIPMALTYEENWHNIIDRIESEIKKLQNSPRSPTRTEKLKEYSNAAVNFRYFKDAWRNHVSHARESYAELEATTVYNHVREFTQVLGKHLGPVQ